MMAPSVHARYYDTGRQFISLDHRPNVPNIIAVLLGGSSIYRGRDECRGSDWDGAIVVSTKLEIVRLVNEQRSSLMAMLGIVQEECPELRVPDESSPDWDHFDCIRIAGFDRLQTKRSVKILSLDYFSEPRNSLRVLSFKDKRIFEAYRPPATRFYRVQQATRLEGGLFVLHDQWVYTAPFTCVHEQDASFAAFGVTADLLVSGFWVQGHDPHGLLIQKYILARYTDISALYANAQTFAKSQRFSHEYCSWLAEELSTLYKQPDMPSERPRCQCCSVKRTFLCGEAITALGQHSTKPPAQSMILSSWSRDSSTQMKTLTSPKRRELPPSPFSSNSTAAEITLPAGTLGAKATRIFCKRCQYPEQEVQGALSAATFGLYVQLPYAMPSGELWYPFFEGKTESELRLSYHHGGWSNAYAAEALLYAELVKAEDMLRLYSKCITNTQERNETWHIEDASSANRRRDNCHPGTMSGRGGTTEQPIHLFFYSRLVENVRFLQFYRDSIPIGQHLTIAEFLKIPWKVNGVVYPSLGELFQIATDVLHPSFHIQSLAQSSLGWAMLTGRTS